MEIEELFQKVTQSRRAGKELIIGNLNVLFPNGEKIIQLNKTNELKLGEEQGENEYKEGNIIHDARNYYYLKMLGTPDWRYVGESSDRSNKYELVVPIDQLTDRGVYLVAGILYGENDKGVYFSSGTCQFEIE